VGKLYKIPVHESNPCGKIIQNTYPWIPSMWENYTKYLPMNPIHEGK
jgi:hypothetical protein